MEGLKIIPHKTLTNSNMEDIVRGLHTPKKYSERYNFKMAEELKKEGEKIPLKKIFSKELFEGVEETDLLVIQNNFIYEVEITKNNTEFRLLHKDLSKIKQLYSKYIDRIKFSPKIEDYEISVENCMAVEMVTNEHFMFALQSQHQNSLEPLKYILDLKRNLKDEEKIIFQVIAQPISNDWWADYDRAYTGWTREKIYPKKFRFTLAEAVQMVAKLGLDITLESLYIVEEIFLGQKGVNVIDTTSDKALVSRADGFLSQATTSKVKDVGFEVSIRGLMYAKTESRRRELKDNFAVCFSCLKGDNNLVCEEIPLIKKPLFRKEKQFKNNINRIKNRELLFKPLISQKTILGVKELKSFLFLPQTTLQSTYNLDCLDFFEADVPKELQEGGIPIGHIYGGQAEQIAFWSKIKDVMCLSKVVVGVKGSGKSKYIENYVYMAYKQGDCVVYFDYIENNANAKEVSRHIPKKDVIQFDLSKGFTFEYPELDITTIPQDEEYERTMKRYASEYAKLIESFINTINFGEIQELTPNMKNILSSASSISLLAGNTNIYSIYQILSNHNQREKAIRLVKAKNIYEDCDFRFACLNSLNEYNEKGKVIGTNSKADRIMDRFGALMRDSRTEEMLLGIDRNKINFVDVFEQNKVVLVLMEEEYFSNYELKDVVMSYFLSRMWLSGLKRAKVIEDREQRKVVHIILDEIHQLKNSVGIMAKNIAEDRKFRMNYFFTCQYLKQFGDFLEAVKGAGCHYMILSGAEKSNFVALKEEIGDNYKIDELVNLPPRSSLNIVRYNGQNIKTFITDLPPKLENKNKGNNYLYYEDGKKRAEIIEDCEDCVNNQGKE